MAILDLQAMEQKRSPQKAPAGSRASKNCGNTSFLSLLLCG